LERENMNKSYRNGFFFVVVSIILFVALFNGLQIIAQQTSQSGNHIHVPGNADTIQEAINIANDGDYVEVHDSITPYSENVVVNRSLTVRKWPQAPINPVVRGSFLVTANDSVVSTFTIQNGDGIRVYNCSNCRLERNNITLNTNGIYLQSASNCTLTDNVLVNNTYSFGVDGHLLSDFLHNITWMTNTINGKWILYLMNERGLTVDPTTFPNTGYLGVVNSTNMTIQNLSFQSNHQGVLLAYTNNSIIQNITASNNYIGVALRKSSYNKIQDTASSNNDVGIDLNFDSSNNMIRNNSIYYSSYSFGGIYVGEGCGNTVSDNYISSASQTFTSGIYLSWSSYNTFHGNTIVNNFYGIELLISNNNTFFHNNVYNRKGYQAHSMGSTTIWELNGLEGNYWSDYTGFDTDSDGIGNTPYDICNDTETSEANNDTCPLMEPWNPIRTHSDVYWYGPNTVTTLSNSTVANFTLSDGFKPPFAGEKAILINITSGAGGFCNVTILRLRLDGPFRLFIDGEERFDYDLDQNETHSALYFNVTQGIHNVEIVGKEFGLIFGDLNGDGRVDGKDIAIIAKNYGKRSP
jgi:parallel beta-helix repeat protein